MAKGGFRGGYGGGMNQANMIKQAQKMQEELRRMQEEIENSVFEATAGGGVVKAAVGTASTSSPRSPSTPRPWTRRTWRCSRTWSSPR